MPNLNLVANLGLILFLFLVGLEVDVRFLASNWRIALSVALGGMALPFGLGCAIAWGLYHQFGKESGTVPISFGVFMLFVGVAMAITVRFWTWAVGLKRERTEVVYRLSPFYVGS
jgi:Kef-type K+ transport system membrane component KefB